MLMADEPHAPCPICIRPVVRFKGETWKRWAARLACSVPCANKLRSISRRKVPVVPKLCVICDDEFTIRSDEFPRDFIRRLTCGAEECRSQLQSQNSNRNGLHCDPVNWHIETWPIDYAGGFGRASIDPGDKRGSIPLRPATHVAKESSIA